MIEVSIIDQLKELKEDIRNDIRALSKQLDHINKNVETIECKVEKNTIKIAVLERITSDYSKILIFIFSSLSGLLGYGLRYFVV